MKQPVKRYLKVLLNLLLALAALLLCIFALPRLLLFFMPFLVGWIIAAIANPLVRFFEEKLRIKRKAGSAVVIVTVIALVILVGYLLISRLAAAGVGFVEMLPQLWNNLEADFKEIGQNLSVLYDGLPENIRDSITNLGQEMDGLVARTVSRLGTPTVNAVGNLAKNIPNMLINAINGEEVDCVLSALSSPLQEELISKNRNVMNARVWLGLGKDGIPVAAKGIGGGRIGQFFMKQIFKKEIEKSKKRGN